MIAEEREQYGASQRVKDWGGVVKIFVWQKALIDHPRPGNELPAPGSVAYKMIPIEQKESGQTKGNNCRTGN